MNKKTRENSSTKTFVFYLPRHTCISIQRVSQKEGNMYVLPDELWSRILEIGVIESSSLDFKDLCSLSITCRRFNRLSSEDYLWSALLSSDFRSQQPLVSHTTPLPTASSSSWAFCKFVYKTSYERETEQKLWAHKRVIFRIESEIAECSRKICELETQSAAEKDRMEATIAELLNLDKARHASVALNVWQPEVIRGQQKKIVEQHDVPVESRISTLEMELRLCKKQFAVCCKALDAEKVRLEAAKEKLASAKYHPLNDFSSTTSKVNAVNKRRKKLKRGT